MNITKKKKNTFFENYDLYSDSNPKDSIRIKYDSLENTIKTIRKLESLYKNDKYPHNRIVQVANVMTQRLRVINPNDPRTKLSKRYFEFLKDRTKKKTLKERKEMKFRI